MKLLDKIKGNKLFLWIILCIFLVMSVFYYFYSYFQNHIIIFTAADCCIVIILGVCILIVAILCIFLIFKVDKLANNINKLKGELETFVIDLVADVEDNNVELHRTTQLIIIDFADKLGVRFDEKEQ